ncbi:cytochrome P450 [Actinomadura sp. WAC 06369]|uniref:cytochrome P450 n=1 Tax=Actinomadura sp. WAC 06369 TaxID=2203193 RepID=UPI000F76F2D4|nr:cytochrome P450 [Actinomadura sp. WAC 06369]RSN72148.1 cytochrome P450 [Actinomadura sp. WAC 06369]
MTVAKAEFPFGPVPPAEALQIMRAIRDDRPMTKVAFPVGGECWMLHRHETCRAVLEDRRFVRKPFTDGRPVPYAFEFPAFLTQTLQFMDPPDHTRFRRLVSKAFTLRRVERLRGKVQDIADELVDAMVAAGPPANLVESFALRLPIRVIGDMLGVPQDGRGDFVRWSHAMLATSGMTEDEVTEAMTSLYLYLQELMTRKRDDPRDDLLSALVAARDADDRLTDDEIIQIAMLLVAGGFDNTANFIELGVQALLADPGQHAALLADIDGVIATAVEEILRHGGFVLGQEMGGFAGLVPFVASEDVELDGVLIKAGDAVAVDLGTANHDDGVFADSDRFDVTRERNPHLTLSHGLHHCLGAPLARMELQVGIATLFRRLPELKLAGEPVYLEGVLTGGMTDLPVTW